MAVDILGNQGGPESARGEGIGGVEETNVVAFLVGEDREIEGAGKVVVGKFGRGADVDQFRKFVERKWGTDFFGKLH